MVYIFAVVSSGITVLVKMFQNPTSEVLIYILVS